MKVITRDERPRPTLSTPAKGTLGDCTDETMQGECDVGRIIQRYGGNLAELARWRGSMSFGEQVNHNLEDNIERFKMLENAVMNLPNKPFASLDEAFKALEDGSFDEKVSCKPVVDEVKVDKVSEVKDEAHEGVEESV